MRASLVATIVFSLTTACAEPASPRAAIVVSPESLRLFAGDTGRLRVAGATAPVMWRSAAPAVASVDAGGLVTALTPGLAAVWAVRGPDSAAASVEVVRVLCLLGPVMAPVTVTIPPGDTARLEARDGCARPAAGFTWVSADTAVAVVEPREAALGRSAAVVRARGPGQAAITARSVDDPAVQSAVAVTVRAP